MSNMALTSTTILSILCIILMIAFICLGILHIRSKRRSQRQMYYDDEKESLFSARSDSPVPEIRLTFPDDAEHNPSKQVIVEVSAAGCAFVRDIPKEDAFKELNLDDLGGLKEKV